MTGERLSSVPTLRSVGRVVALEGSGEDGAMADNRGLGYRNDRATCPATTFSGRSVTFGVSG